MIQMMTPFARKSSTASLETEDSGAAVLKWMKEAQEKHGRWDKLTTTDQTAAIAKMSGAEKSAVLKTLSTKKQGLLISNLPHADRVNCLQELTSNEAAACLLAMDKGNASEAILSMGDIEASAAWHDLGDGHRGDLLNMMTTQDRRRCLGLLDPADKEAVLTHWFEETRYTSESLRSMPISRITQAVFKMTPGERGAILMHMPMRLQAAVIGDMSPNRHIKEALACLEELSPEQASDVLGACTLDQATRLVKEMSPSEAGRILSSVSKNRNNDGSVGLGGSLVGVSKDRTVMEADFKGRRSEILGSLQVGLRSKIIGFLEPFSRREVLTGISKNRNDDGTVEMPSTVSSAEKEIYLQDWLQEFQEVQDSKTVPVGPWHRVSSKIRARLLAGMPGRQKLACLTCLAPKAQGSAIRLMSPNQAYIQS